MFFLYLAITVFSAMPRFEYYFASMRIPPDWKETETRMANSAMFNKENKKVSVLSFGEEHYYFEYPVIITVYPDRVLSSKDIKTYVKKFFGKFLLPESEKERRIVWGTVQNKKARTQNGYSLVYYGFSGNAKWPESEDVPVAAQIVTVSDGKRSVLIASGFAIADIGGFNQRELANIQNGFTEHMRDVLNAAYDIKFIKLKNDNSLKKALIRKKKFRHESSFSAGLSTGMYSNSVSGMRKLYFDFYKNGTCRFIDNGSITGFFNTTYNGEGVQSGGSAKKSGGGSWSVSAPFDVYKGREKEYLVVHLPLKYGGDRIFIIQKNGREKCGKKTVRGLAISGNVEGYFLTTGGVCTYRK